MMDGFPRVIEGEGNLAAYLADHLQEVLASIDNDGAVLFRGFAVDEVEDFEQAVLGFERPTFSYEESMSNAVRIPYSSRVFTANEAPKEVEIHLHHELAQTPTAPALLFFYCDVPADTGGATPLCRSDLLYEAFKAKHPAWCAQLEGEGVSYRTVMPSMNDEASGQGRSWASTLSVDSKEAAEVRLRELGYEGQWLEDGRLATWSCPLPVVIDITGERRSFFHQLIAAYMGWSGVKDNPGVALRFGGGDALPAEMLDQLVEMSERFTFDLAWQRHDVAVVNNRMVMHGRRAFGGEARRNILVSMAI